MSDYDPSRLNPNRQELPPDEPFKRDTSFNWNWVLGGLAAIVLLLVGMSFINDSQRSAEGIAPSGETTGQSSPPPAAPAERMSPRPVTPSQ